MNGQHREKKSGERLVLHEEVVSARNSPAVVSSLPPAPWGTEKEEARERTSNTNVCYFVPSSFTSDGCSGSSVDDGMRR